MRMAGPTGARPPVGGRRHGRGGPGGGRGTLMAERGRQDPRRGRAAAAWTQKLIHSSVSRARNSITVMNLPGNARLGKARQARSRLAAVRVHQFTDGRSRKIFTFEVISDIALAKPAMALKRPTGQLQQGSLLEGQVLLQ